jgi:hypothetical protein
MALSKSIGGSKIIKKKLLKSDLSSSIISSASNLFRQIPEIKPINYYFS